MKKYSKCIVYVLIFGVISSSCKEKSADKEMVLAVQNLAIEEQLSPRIQSKTDPIHFNLSDRMAYFNVPGASITVIENNTIKGSKGYGMARKEANIPVDANSIFKAGSISKSITAVAIMKLRDRGKLSLDEDISNYLKSWKFPANRFTQKNPITIRHLLNHTSGLAAIKKTKIKSVGFPQNTPLPSLNELLDGHTHMPGVVVDTISGAVFQYSNLGYTILQKIIEDVTDDTFENVTKTLVFDPLQMSHSTFETIIPSEENTQYVYSYKDNAPNEGFWHNSVQKSSGGLFSTSHDLAQFLISVNQSLHTQDGFIPQETAQEMMEGEHYGLGFDLIKKEGSTVLYHSGRVLGFFAFMILNSDTGNGIVVLLNSDDGDGLLREIMRGASQLYDLHFMKPKKVETITVSEEETKGYLGEFLYTDEETGELETISITHENDLLTYLEYYEGRTYKYPLIPLSKTKFIDIIDGDVLDFKVVEGKMDTIIYEEEYRFIRKMN